MPRLSHFQWILLAALVFRLLAAVFSKGFAFSDDHFEVVDVAWKWRLGIPFTEPSEVYLFSLLYPGLHLLVFRLCDALHLTDPQAQLLVVRLLHALVSLLTVYYGMKICNKLTDNASLKSPFQTAHLSFQHPAAPVYLAGWLLAVFWLFPFMSVRCLREFFCIPFLMAGFYQLVAAGQDRLPPLKVLAAGLLFALAFDIRYQSIFFPLGAGLVLLFNKNTWKQALAFGVSFGAGVAVTQLLFDWLYWGNPLASLLAYTTYNATHAADYLVAPWYIYIFTISGVLLVPACFLFFAGYFYHWKKYLLLFLPSFLFIVFHSYFPGKQERFILPFFPFILLLGVLGFRAFYTEKQHWHWLPNVTKALVVWFLVFNTLLLLLLTFTYTKRSRVEALTYLKNKGDVTNFVIEGQGDIQFPPVFYLGKYVPFYEIKASRSATDLQQEIRLGTKPAPNYLIITGGDDLAKREMRMKTIFPHMQREAEIKPGLVDNLAYLLNPEHNVNEAWYIYRLR